MKTAMRTIAVLAAWALVVQSTAQAGPSSDADLACDQPPGNRFFWLERGFCDLEQHGPEKANGVVIWNHGLSGTLEQWRAPVPPAFRLLQLRGWDVVAVKRHNLAETGGDAALYRAVQRTLEEARRHREAGYKKIVLAGQSYGGYITLESAEQTSGVFAAVAMAPGVRAIGGAGALDASITERSLQRVKVERVAVVFPKDDALFGNLVRGENANRILGARRLPYLLLDETSGLTGHGGGTTGRFALRYGACLYDFLSAPTVLAGRFVCPAAAHEGRVAEELLLPRRDAPKLLDDPAVAPPALTGLAGRWYALLDDSLILFALADAATGPSQALYRWASPRVGGTLYDAVIAGKRVSLTLPNQARVVVVVTAEGPILTWTSADGSRILKSRLLDTRKSQ